MIGNTINNNMGKFYKYKLLTALFSVLIYTSCRVEKVKPHIEAVKDITGSWIVVKAVRNGTDVTNSFDFSKFRINFLANKTYVLVNRVPFLVKTDGAYSLDDPLYPFQITFKSTTAGIKPIVTDLEYPLINGVRQIKLTFSPGCFANSYTYIFQKAN